MKRKKFLIVFGIIYLLIVSLIFFGLKHYSAKNFDTQKLNQMMMGQSKFRDTTDNLCHYQILGEPKVGKNYIKINFWCKDSSKARSTFALIGFEDKTPAGILKEYARIIGFDFNIIQNNSWFCNLNDQELNFDDKQDIPLASTIDCFEQKGLPKND